MLDFYRQHDVSPVKQDISDLSSHFARRAHLYRSLGLAPALVHGKTVLEVGPGSGENARYTASLKPWKYVMVEPNPTAAAALATSNVMSWHVVGSPIQECKDLGTFDLVLCEGLLGLSGMDEPIRLLDAVADTVKVGGVLVITCIDAISDHSEVLRRALAQKYINQSMTLQEKVKALVPVFAPHLATLKGMTRSVDDWIIDNILNPASIGATVSIPEALARLDGTFEVLGCNPRFLMDWRWYKEAKPGNQWAIDSYWAQCHNLMDYRYELETHEDAAWANQALMRECQRVREQVAALERGEDVRVATGEVEADPAWFGRGQQYLSLVRVA